MTTEPAPPSGTAPARPSWRDATFAAGYGMIAATLGYAIGRGNPFWMLVVMVVIGVLFRLWAYLLIRNRGADRPRWWKWL